MDLELKSTPANHDVSERVCRKGTAAKRLLLLRHDFRIMTRGGGRYYA